ncbi:hypothetical protein ECPA49_1961, partial [Escherichia coli PA49]
VQLDVNNG